MAHRVKKIVVDGREFAAPKMTGIGRLLLGLMAAMDQNLPEAKLSLCIPQGVELPVPLRGHRHLRPASLPKGFLPSEIAISLKTYRGADLFISAYPKLPLLGCGCPCINMVHDVHDITFSTYASSPRRLIDLVRLKMALRRSDLTWYISHDGCRNTEALIGTSGRHPAVRHLGIGEGFTPQVDSRDTSLLAETGLTPGYILSVGNGMPHKNLGVLLGIWDRIDRPLVLVGVSQANQYLWEKKHPDARAVWIERIPDKTLPVIYRNAYCLAQPSFAEGYGYPPLEAMACGTPAVVSDISVLRETTGENALFASPDSPAQWVDAFQRLADDEFYQNLRCRGLEWTSSLIGNAAWMRHVEDIRQLINL